jgi:hypothetical protein
MTVLANTRPAESREISTAALLAALEGHAGKPLVFSYAGRDVRAGYHVTEVKSGRFDALDCGGNPEAWRETFIQLWDIPPEPGRDFMRAGKFVAIMRKVSDRVAYDGDAKLTFEVSDGKSPIQILRATSIDAEGEAVRIALSARPSSCKPRDRWLEPETPPAKCGCGGEKALASAQACCV